MKYDRILLKLSGESLQGIQKYGLSTDVLHSYAEQIKAVVGTGVQVGIVIGGGNIFRGLQGARKGFDRVKGDQMGMLATIINSLALQSALEEMHLPPPFYDALVSGDGVYAPFLKLARALESFDEKQLAALAHDLHITPDEVNRAHLEALAFADSLQFG